MRKDNLIRAFGYICLTICTMPGLEATDTYTVTSNADSSTGSGNSGTLRYVLKQIMTNAGATDPDIIINFDSTYSITLDRSLPILATNNVSSSTPATITINGNGSTINGNNLNQAFFVTPIYGYAKPGANLTVNIDSLNFENCRHQGGSGGAATVTGGGGLGAGGAIFVDNNAVVTVSNVTFTGSSAIGGDGGTSGSTSGTSSGGGGYGGSGGNEEVPSTGFADVCGTGGGGFRGDGGPIPTGTPGFYLAGSGGGGGNWVPDVGISTNGGPSGDSTPGGVAGGGGGGTGMSGGQGNGSTGVGGSGGGNLQGANGAVGTTGAGADGGAGGGGAGSGNAEIVSSFGGDGGFGGGGGGGGSSQDPNSGGGAGGAFGGGGGATYASTFAGGDGGEFGGGGGSGGSTTSPSGGKGGFGGGGGGGSQSGSSPGGDGGFGGGGGGVGGVGGTEGGSGGTLGAGFDAVGGGGAGLGGAIFVRQGGTLNIGSGCSFSGSSVTAGAAGTGGSGSGQTPGNAKGSDLYIMDSTTVAFTAPTTTLTGTLGLPPTIDFHKTGAGTLALSQASDYTGNTLIDGGALQISADNQLGTGAATVTFSGASTSLIASGTFSTPRAITTGDDSTVSVTGSNTLTITGTLDGALATALNVNDGTTTGTLLLTTPSTTHAGGTTVKSGTLALSLAGNLNSGAPLSIASPGTFDISGITAASRQVGDLSGSGTVKLGGKNLTLGTGTDSIIFSGAIEDGGISGGVGGTIAKVGSGKLTLSGTSTYTGDTTVSAGELNVEGSLTSAVVLGVNTILSGTGSIGGLTSDGIVGPGNSIGTLTINGPLVLNAGSVVENEVTPTSSDLIQVIGGTATLNGELQIIPLSGTYAQTQTYTVLTATGGLGGTTFSSLVVTDPNFQVTAVYFPTMVQIIMETMGSLFQGVHFLTSNIESVANNINALNAAGDLAPGSDLANVINSLAGQSDAVVNNALNQLHPAQFSALEELQTEVGAEIVSIFHNRPNRKCSEFKPFDIWLEPFGNVFKIDNVGQQTGFHATVGGVAGGFDAKAADNWVIGFGGAYDHSWLKWKENRGHADVDSYYGAIYTDYKTSKVYLGATVLAGKDHYHTTRKIDFLTTDRHAVGRFNGYDIVGQLSGGLFWGSSRFVASPYVNLDYLYLHENRFTEKKAQGLNLNVSAYTSETFRSETGMSFRYRLGDRDKPYCFTPLISLSWIANVPLHRDKYRSTFVEQTIPFEVKGWDRTWNLVAPSAGITFSLPHFAFTMQYTAEIGSHFLAQKGNARLDFTW